MTPSQIKKKYEKRILKIMETIREAVIESGFVCSKPYDMSCDDFRYSMYVNTKEQEEKGIEDQGVDITFIIAESEYWDGEKGGVNFMLDIVSYGGQMIGGLIPYNYTDEVWVSRKDKDAIEERFRVMERADAKDVPELIEDYLWIYWQICGC